MKFTSMTQVSTELKTHVIVFKDGSTKFLSNGENNAMERAMNNRASSVQLTGGYIDFKVIAKYLDIMEYYKQYPQNKPKQYESFSGSSIGKIDLGTMPLKKMILGLEGYINSDRYQGSEAPKEILKKMKERLARAEKGEKVEVNSLSELMK